MAELQDCVTVTSLEVIDPALIPDVAVVLDGIILTQGGAKQPALQWTWSTITNPYILGLQFEVGPSDFSSGIVKQDANKAALATVMTNGLIGGKTYTGRYRAVGDGVFGPWSGYQSEVLSADWVSSGVWGDLPWTQVTGDTRPSDNAGTSVTMVPMDAYGKVRGNRVWKEGGGVGDWAAGNLVSTDRFVGGASVSFRRDQGSTYASMTGLSSKADMVQSYTRIDYGIYFTSANVVNIYENGSGYSLGDAIPVLDTDLFTITYDGAFVRYFKITAATGAETLLRIVAAPPGLALRVHVSLYHVGTETVGGIRDLQFKPFAHNSAAAVTLYDWQGNIYDIAGNEVRKRADLTPGWATNVYSREGFTNGCSLSGRLRVQDTMLGITDAITSSDYSQIKFGFHRNGTGNIILYENGSAILDCGVRSVDVMLSVLYDGARVYYFIDGTLQTPGRGSVPNRRFYVCAACYSTSTVAAISDISFTSGAQASILGVTTYRGDTNALLAQAEIRTPEGIAASVAGQGPGATAAANRVLNDRLENGVRTIAQPDGGVLNVGTSGGVGQLQIVLPFGATDSMLQFELLVYDYAANQTVRYIIGGYNYNSGPTWINISVLYIGPRGFARPVKFGYYLGKAYIWIGDVGSAWSYTIFAIRNLTIGYNNQALAWESGWNLSLNNTNINGLVNAFVAVPRSGDAVMGEGILRGDTLALVPQYEIRTPEGISGGYAGQQPVATQVFPYYAGNAAALAALGVGKGYYDSTNSNKFSITYAAAGTSRAFFRTFSKNIGRSAAAGNAVTDTYTVAAGGQIATKLTLSSYSNQDNSILTAIGSVTFYVVVNGSRTNLGTFDVTTDSTYEYDLSSFNGTAANGYSGSVYFGVDTSGGGGPSLSTGKVRGSIDVTIFA